jgi:hypothetical protein
MSIWSFPERGPWGDPKWRGNCSGFVYLNLFQRLKPKVFVDPMVGSGTSCDVAKELGIEAYGLDLHSGFNILKHSILEKVGKPSDLCLSHPPYGSMIVYSGPGGMWGKEAHPDDLSRCDSVQDFHEKLQLSLINQRDAVLPGGYYGTIIGDHRVDGHYVSYQSEAIARMPAAELAAVIIKAQHNVQSGSKSYGRMVMPMVMHEYILLWKKKEMTVISFLKTVATEAQNRLTGTWKNVVRQSLIKIGGKADLATLYQVVEKNSDRVDSNPHWKEKVRQILNQNPNLFQSGQRGVWALA